MRVFATAVAAVVVLAGCGILDREPMTPGTSNKVESMEQYRRIEAQVDSAITFATDQAAAAVGGKQAARRAGDSSPSCNELDNNQLGFTREIDVAIRSKTPIGEGAQKIANAWDSARWPAGLRVSKKGDAAVFVVAQGGPELMIFAEPFDDEVGRGVTVSLSTPCLEGTDEVKEKVVLDSVRRSEGLE